jgi:uncharacterized protein
MSESFTKYIILLSKVANTKDTETLIRDHVSFLRKLQDQNQLILCGPFSDYSGGMIIINAKSKNEAIAIAESDPFVSAGNRSYEVRTWNISCEENNHLGMG